MPRARNIKHEFFKNEDLAEVSFEARLLFIGLWTLADCKGRLEYRPKRIRAEIFPYDPVDVVQELSALDSSGFIQIYRVNDKQYIEILNFEKHQNPHKNERDKGSLCPDPIQTNPDLSGDSQATDFVEVESNPDLSGQVPSQDGTDPADSLLLNPESGILNPEEPAPSDEGYAFQGQTFNINQKDYANHQKIYPKLNLLKEYQQLDVELRDERKSKVWHTLNSKLNYRNKNAKPKTEKFALDGIEYESGDL